VYGLALLKRQAEGLHYRKTDDYIEHHQIPIIPASARELRTWAVLEVAVKAGDVAEQE